MSLRMGSATWHTITSEASLFGAIQRPPPAADFLKCDAMGAEVGFSRGLKTLLDGKRKILLVDHEQPETHRRMARAILPAAAIRCQPSTTITFWKFPMTRKLIALPVKGRAHRQGGCRRIMPVSG